MGDPRGFLKYERREMLKEPVQKRIKNFNEFVKPRNTKQLGEQAARCLDCGIPFCHEACPLGNVIPEFNDMLYRGHYVQALKILQNTNCFPEFTGRICPAPCEGACIHNANGDAVAIKQIEFFLAQWAVDNGHMTPVPPAFRTGRRVAVFGSGPAGLAAAMRLNEYGHTVTVFEKDDRIGGLLRYGIPDYKLEKHVIDLRVKKMEGEGVQFVTSADLEQLSNVPQLENSYNAVVLAVGAGKPRDLPMEGRGFEGVHFAMGYLTQQNKRTAGDTIDTSDEIWAKDKDVVVIGGGDTGADCAGTAIRQGAKSVMQIELLEKPPKERAEDNPWPEWPLILRTATSHEEGGERDWAIRTVSFEGENGKLTGLNCIRVEWSKDDSNRMQMKDIPGSEFKISADLVFIAAGFVGPTEGFVEKIGVGLNPMGYPELNKNMQTSLPWIFGAGDVRIGPSLVVSAIADGMNVASEVDKFLQTVL